MAVEFPISLVIRALDRVSGPLRVISARVKRFTEPFKKFGKAFGEVFGGAGSAAANVGREALALGQKLGLMAGAAGVALFALVKGTVDAGDAIAKTSDRLGLSVDAYQQLSFVAGRAGMSQEEFTTSLDFFNKSLGLAKAGTGGLLQFLNRVSPALARQVRGAKGTEAAFDLMLKAMFALKDPAKRATFATQMFGRAGAKMGALVANGVEDVAKLRAEFMRISGSQERFARSSEVLNDAMGDVEVAFTGVKVALLTEFFPVFTQLAESLKAFLIENREGIAAWARKTAAAITAWVRGGGIQRITEGFQRFFAVINPIVERLGGWPLVLGAIAGAILTGPLLGALASLGAALITLGVALAGTPLGWFLLGAVAIAGAAALILANWEPVRDFFQKFFPTFSKTVEDVVLGISALASGLGKVVGWIRQLQAFQEGQVASAAAGKQTGFDKFAQDVIDQNPLVQGLRLLNAADPFGMKRSSTGAASVGPRGATAGGEARLTVDFNNVPKGTRVAAEGDAPIDWSLGYAAPWSGAVK